MIVIRIDPRYPFIRMFGKLITLIFVLVTVEAFSLRSANDEEAIGRNTIEYRLPTDVVPIHYDLKIDSNIATGDFNYTGETDINIEVRKPTNKIVLNWLHLTLDEARTRLEKQNEKSHSPKEHLYDAERQMLTLVFDDIVAPAIYTLHLEFSGVLSDGLRGFYRSSYINENGDKTWLAVTHFQPIHARKSFPCWDEPALKATFNISVKHHANYTTLSNMPAFDRSPVNGNEDKVWTRFERTPIMSTHILAFIISDFVNISTPDGSVRVWARKSIIPNMQYFFDIVQRVSDDLQDYMNNSLAVPKMDHVAVPDFSGRATENWGVIAYREESVVYYPNETTVNQKDSITMLAAHEMTHQWISNLVGPSWWRYMWMSEGFAAYFQFQALSKVINNSRIIDVFPLQVQQETVFDMDTCPSGNPMNRDVSSPNEMYTIYSLITYRKAPIILRMLMNCLTEEVFRAGLLKYLHTHQYSTAVPDDLWRSMQDALDQSSVPHEGFKVKEVMDTWTEHEGYPVIYVNRNYDTGEVKVRQENLLCTYKWWVPLNFATEANPDFSSTLPTHWLNSSEETKTIKGLPKDGWIIANIQETAYYRVKYDLENWRRLARYLNSDNYNKIHIINRLQIIQNAYRGITMEELPYDVFGMVLNYLSRETHVFPWMGALYLSDEMEHLLKFPECSDIIKPFVRHLLSNSLKNMDYQDRSDDERLTKYKKLIIKNLSCMIDVPESLGNATLQLAEYLENPDSIIIRPESLQWLFCCGLRRANQSIWNSVLDLYVKKGAKPYLDSLVCSENKSILENLLNMTLSDDSPLEMGDIMDLYSEMIRNGGETSLNTMIDFLGNNLNTLSSKEVNMERILNLLSGKIITTEQLEKMTVILTSTGSSTDKMIQRWKTHKDYINEVVMDLEMIVKGAQQMKEQ